MSKRPSQRSSRFGSTARNGGVERGRPRSRRLDSHLEPRALAELAADPADERIPLRVGGEVGYDRPHPFGRRIEFDLSVKFSHLPTIMQQVAHPKGLSRDRSSSPILNTET
jgi:hypothetical protein